MIEHKSDCALHCPPAEKPSKICDCGAKPTLWDLLEFQRELVKEIRNRTPFIIDMLGKSGHSNEKIAEYLRGHSDHLALAEATLAILQNQEAV